MTGIEDESANSALAFLDGYRLDAQPIFVVGSFDTGVTVLSQQIRGLNLVWALVNSLVLGAGDSGPTKRVAIVGGGFAGLTTAAGLLAKDVNASITLIERCDTVLPLQQGSDSRWVHPHIYSWPVQGSESFSAALPLMNWTANRASDVVVQVLRDWERQVSLSKGRGPGAGREMRVFCNARHVQISEAPTPEAQVHIEWVGEPRAVNDPSVPFNTDQSQYGLSEAFDIVILAVGFGLEDGSRVPYWRNETLAQPNLSQAILTYIVSGTGDGGMIDLFRLRISQFRQDRILAELFGGKADLIGRLREIEVESRVEDADLFDCFSHLMTDGVFGHDMQAVVHAIADRLRRDTRVILHIRVAKFADLFKRGRVSFQNRLLAFLLYKAGGFFPSTTAIDDLAAEHDIPEDRIIRRHGTDKARLVNSILGDTLHPSIKAAAEPGSLALRQAEDVKWPGGYFGFRGPILSTAIDDETKSKWRKEYLPGPTQSVATAFCAAIAGFLAETHPPNKRLRVALHRVLLIGPEAVLQQCCEYSGIELEEPGGSAARTFPSDLATIGMAYVRRRIVCTQSDADPGAIREDTINLKLDQGSRTMDPKVQSVAALPLLSVPPNPQDAESVTAILYIDSEESGFLNNPARMKSLWRMSEEFLKTVRVMGSTDAGTIVNNEFWVNEGAAGQSLIDDPPNLPESFELHAMPPPRVANAPYFNFDFSDFQRVED